MKYLTIIKNSVNYVRLVIKAQLAKPLSSIENVNKSKMNPDSN